jgi:hypothetical protein
MGFSYHGFGTRDIALTVESPYPWGWIVKPQLPPIHKLQPFREVTSTQFAESYKNEADS